MKRKDEVRDLKNKPDLDTTAKTVITLATRGSPLALCQAELVQASLCAAYPTATVEILKIRTTGDRQTEWSLEKRGGKGLFTKELEESLLSGAADIAVHSAKDLPTEMPEGLDLAGYLPREDPRDVFVLREGVVKPRFIASGSPRRRSQLKALYPGVVWSEIRGNVNTRLNKVVNLDDVDATVLAAAGLNRLKISAWPGLRFEFLAIEQVVPAAGQAAIAVQTRAADIDRFEKIMDKETGRAVSLERCFLAELGGGCHLATAAHVVGCKMHVFHDTHGYAEFKLRQATVSEENFDVVREVADQYK